MARESIGGRISNTHSQPIMKEQNMKQQFVVTHTIRQAEIPAILDRWLINTPSVRMLCPHRIACFYIFVTA